MADTKMSTSGNKTGLKRAPHSRRPEVAKIVFNQDTGKMELVDPKSEINRGIDLFQGYRDKLANSAFINTPKEKYGQVFGASGKREVVKLFKEHRRREYNKNLSPAQRAAQQRFKERAAPLKGKGRPPQLARSARANLLRNNYKAAESKARKAQQDLARASKPKKPIVKKEYRRRAYPEEIASQTSRTARQYARDAVEDDDDLFM